MPARHAIFPVVNYTYWHAKSRFSSLIKNTLRSINITSRNVRHNPIHHPKKCLSVFKHDALNFQTHDEVRSHQSFQNASYVWSLVWRVTYHHSSHWATLQLWLNSINLSGFYGWHDQKHEKILVPPNHCRDCVSQSQGQFQAITTSTLPDQNSADNVSR